MSLSLSLAWWSIQENGLARVMRRGVLKDGLCNVAVYKIALWSFNSGGGNVLLVSKEAVVWPPSVGARVAIRGHRCSAKVGDSIRQVGGTNGGL